MTTLHRLFSARTLSAAFLAATALAWTGGASAALFEDDEARRAILDLRQRVEQQRQDLQRQLDAATQDSAQLRRSVLELQQMIEQLRQENARLNGANEQLTRDVAEMQRRQKDIA